MVGGVFLQMLHDGDVWQKWAGRDETKADGYAPMPKPAKVTAQVPAADTSPSDWRYTTAPPAENWQRPSSMTPPGKRA